MTNEEILDNLCAYDPRSPDYADIVQSFDAEDIPAPREGCYCDNCFYGRDRLAAHILSDNAESSRTAND
jgi:hypothetical protein